MSQQRHDPRHPEMTRIEITIGALSKPITEQLGIDETEDTRRWQHIHDAVVSLSVHGYLRQSEKNRIGNRLVMDISKELGVTQ